MGLFKSLKGKQPDANGGDTSNTKAQQTSHEKRSMFGSRSDDNKVTQHDTNGYAPPPGPPPSYTSSNDPKPKHDSSSFAPPPGPPPSYLQRLKKSDTTDFAPPPGPPPSHANENGDDYAPPPGPPPSKEYLENPPPYHDWASVPDNTDLPPPPSLRYDTSTTGNAPEEEANRAHDFCFRNALFQPSSPAPQLYRSVQVGDVRIQRPREFGGDVRMLGKGIWRGQTRSGARDSILTSTLPVYFAMEDSPYKEAVSGGGGRKKTIYFEVKVRQLGRGRGSDEASVAIGFVAQPYPTWRLPGWERGSLGVHGDDGRRYVNDTWGGKDFVRPWREGETVGVGMRFEVAGAGEGELAEEGKCAVEVFFTRNGQVEGIWNLHETLDHASGGVDGLEGDWDLYAGVGAFGGVEFDIVFDRGQWIYRPE